MSPEATSATGWTLHAGLLVFLGALAIPVFVVDRLFLGPGGGGWISLDFRGLLIGAFAVWWVVHALLSSAGLKLGGGQAVWSAHGGALVLEVALAIGGWTFLHWWEDQRFQAHERRLARARERATGALEVVSWRFLPDAGRPLAEAQVRTAVAGAIAADLVLHDTVEPSPWPDAREPAAVQAGVHTLRLEVADARYHPDLDGGAAPRVRLRVSWQDEESRFPVCLGFCHPSCPEEEGGEVPLRPMPAQLRQAPASDEKPPSSEK